MADVLVDRILHAGRLFTLRDVRCRPACSECGGDEHTEHDNIVFVRRGAFVRRMRGKDSVADPSRVLFFHRDEPYRVYHPVSGGDNCTSLTFSNSILQEAFHREFPGTGDVGGSIFPWSDALLDGSCLAQLQLLRQMAGSAVVDELDVEEAALKLLARIVGHRSNPQASESAARSSTLRAHGRLVLQTRIFLASAFRHSLSLSDVAKVVHSSPYHLARVFARETGCSIHRTIVRLRLASGLEALCGGADHLTRLALELGFASHAHFSHAFHTEFGIAPSLMRLSKRNFPEMSRILKATHPIVN